MADIKVDVTAALIERATQRDSRHCMIAEAIQAAHPHFKNILVDLATIRWTNPRTGKRYVCLTPETAGSQLVRFDQGQSIEPFSFRLQVIQTTVTQKKAESAAEARAQGRSNPRTTNPTRDKTVSVSPSNGRVHIQGGRPLPGGHLRGTTAPDTASATPAPEPDDDASNRTRSSRRYRQYGRRLLQP